MKVQLNLRCDDDDSRLIRSAAAIEGKTPGEYLLAAAGSAATRTLEKVISGEPFNLPSKRDAIAEFMELLGRSSNALSEEKTEAVAV